MCGEELFEKLRSFDETLKPRQEVSQFTVEITSERLLPFLKKIQSAEVLKFELLLDHTVVDWIEEQRFELVYLLYSLHLGEVIQVSTFIARDNPYVHSVSEIWPIAQWQEREVFDFFGIHYIGHPDLQRLFLEDDWKGFPLRKDYKDSFMLEFPKDA